MGYIEKTKRNEALLFPEYLDDYVEKDCPVRLFDAFVDSLNLQELGFGKSTPEVMGRPPYDPRDLLKVLLYGYFYGVRSSRRLARECRCNVELMWLTGKLTPDFRTLSDFRKDNIECMEPVFKEFNRYCMRLKILSKSFISIDGSKFKAVNAKDRNFTLNKLDDRLAWLDSNIKHYLAALEEADAETDERKMTKEEIEAKLKTLQERKERYEGYLREMESTGQKQKSLTDPDAKLMKCNEGYCVGYNTQTAVEDGSHMVVGFKVTDSPTDHGQITSLATEVKKDTGADIIEAVADKGYQSPSDMSAALENGIVPNVIQRDGETEVDVDFDYNPSEADEIDSTSRDPEDIRKCLQSGCVPEVYDGILDNPRIVTVNSTEYTIDEDAVLKMTEEQMAEEAKKGYLIRDPYRNLVICPEGAILRQKSIKKNGDIRYCNKLACKNCKNKCTTAAFKEADFSKDKLVIKVKGRDNNNDDRPDTGIKIDKKVVTRQVVRYRFKLDEKKMNERKCLSEHPFGTVKRAIGMSYLLLKGKRKVIGETALMLLSYNLRRAISMRGVENLVKAMV